MSDKFKIELYYDGVGDNILRSGFMNSYIASIGSEKANQAGSGYKSSVHNTGQRYCANVYPATEKAIKDNSKNNTLLKVMNLRT